MPIKIYLVDAFVGDVERGNPAGVCLLDGPADPEWMQEIADEMAQAETAFLYRDGSHWQLRWVYASLRGRSLRSRDTRLGQGPL